MIAEDFPYGDNDNEPLPDFKGAPKMANEVATREAGLSLNLQAWGKQKIQLQLVTTPRLVKGEPMTQAVIDGKMKVGEFANSLTGEILGGLDRPIEIVPFAVKDLWREYDIVETKGKVKREFKQMLAVTPENEGLPYKDKDGKTERDRVLDIYCVLSKDLETLPADWRERGLKPLPIIISFSRTSFRTGKQIYTQMFIVNESKGLPPPATVMALGGKTVKGEDGTYGVFEASPSRKAVEMEMDIAFHWFKALQAGQIKADEAAEKEAEEGPKDF